MFLKKMVQKVLDLLVWIADKIFEWSDKYDAWLTDGIRRDEEIPVVELCEQCSSKSIFRVWHLPGEHTKKTA